MVHHNRLHNFPRNDQLRVSPVSPQLCAIARGIIYRNVELKNNHPGVVAARMLLNRDYSVARNVKKLHINTVYDARLGPIWPQFDAGVLAGMRNLHTLKFTGLPFQSEEAQIKFNNTVSESLPALSVFNLRSPVLQISGLQEITWISPRTFLPPSPVLIPLTASRETLTHIRVLLRTSNNSAYEPLTQFFSLRFPCLSTLHIGGWNTAIPVGAAFTTFLMAHPLIEVLILCFLDLGWNEHCHISESPDVALSPGALPNLRHLTADAFNLGVFLRSGVLSLRTLESLQTGVRHFDEEQEEGVQFVEMLDALEVYGGLPGLKVLELELGLYNEEENAYWFNCISELCPGVEQL